MAEIGFLPCFSCYLHKHFPLIDFYQQPAYIRRVKDLLSAFVDSPNPQQLKSSIGGHDIRPVRPGSAEENSLIRLCHSPFQIYRIDYGNNPFRIVFAFDNTNRFAYVYAVDTKHQTMRGKHK